MTDDRNVQRPRSVLRGRRAFLSSVICLLSSLLLLVARSVIAQPALTPFEVQKARALLRSQLPCLGCHELDGDGGKVGPSLTTVGSRRSVGYIRAMVEDPQRRVPGSAMPRAVMPESTRDLVIRFLARGATSPETPPVLPPPKQRAALPGAARPDGPALYARWCASCHGARGKGDGVNAKSLPVPPAVHASATVMSERPDDSLFDTIAGGGIVMGRSARMPAFGATLSFDEMRALVAQIRSLCKCAEPAWARRSAGR